MNKEKDLFCLKFSISITIIIDVFIIIINIITTTNWAIILCVSRMTRSK
jgi:hypothetical protein